MAKNFIKNTSFSLLTLVLSSLIFTFLGFFVVDLLGGASFVGLLVLLFGLLCFGYFIGRELQFGKAMDIVSIVVLPIIIIAAVYGLFMVVASVISMILHYPATLWLEALNISADDSSAMFYVVAVAHYLVTSFGLLVGAGKKRSK